MASGKEKKCSRLIDCSQCPHASEDSLFHIKRRRSAHVPSEKCTQNCIIFMLKGELLINSNEYPGTILRDGQFILQAIGSKLELLALTDVEYVIYWFSDLPQICEARYRKILEVAEAPLTYTPLVTIPKLSELLYNICEYLDEDASPCSKFVEIKCQELVYVLTCYYPLPQLSIFFYPISQYRQTFHYFIMQNYDKVKNVEEFAALGGYATTTFRRLFKNVYGEPVYEWILNKKREGILNDLQFTTLKITEISQKYGFDSLSHFAHFCRSSFGDSPRSLRTRATKGEVIYNKK
ncbi:helix-turn-helix transcriptional regulator [Bacteroides sp. 519]|uniref:helix-turn-helix transcriptional regulator n=1 Tax=Bacteroides sp. 519 TaxID=2302937 RepID=UPI0013CF4FA8|nr:helix-turn-helix transcriptional regulator [Bacteroides sp. 519]NDV57593.1 AraC family transcriptional regulator [Bacteroides sp. 519]